MKPHGFQRPGDETVGSVKSRRLYFRGNTGMENRREAQGQLEVAADDTPETTRDKLLSGLQTDVRPCRVDSS